MKAFFKRESIRDTLEFRVSDFNTLVAFLGGFLSLFGLVSYLIKEHFYLSETRRLYALYVWGI